MGRKNQEPIKTRSFMPLTQDGAVKVCISDLTYKQKDYLGALLQTRVLNAVHVGRLEFWAENLPSIEEVFPEAILSQ